MAALLPEPARLSPTHVHVSTDASRATQLNPNHMGCHTDSGYVHQVRFWSSQMLFGESFEAPPSNITYGVAADAWSTSVSPSMQATFGISGTLAPAMHGASARTITVASLAAQAAQLHNAPVAALSNRGLGNEGLFFEAGKPYEGYCFVRCAAPGEQSSPFHHACVACLCPHPLVRDHLSFRIAEGCLTTGRFHQRRDTCRAAIYPPVHGCMGEAFVRAYAYQGNKLRRHRGGL